MSKYEYIQSDFRITHTIEKTGTHQTIPYDFYEDTFAITILLQGSGTCYIEEKNYSISKGSIVVLSPEDIHSFKFSQTGYHERISIYLSGAMLSGFNQHQLDLIRIFRDFNAKKRYIFQRDCYNHSTVLQLANDLCSIMEDAEIEMQAARIHIILLRLLFILYDCMKTTLDTAKTDTQSSVVVEICTYIKAHLKEPLSYKEFENHFFISRYQLAKKFQLYTGMTLTEYIITKRLMNVISLVRNGEGIETAAYNSGFNTYSHFYKEFVKHFNFSPREYFNQKRGNNYV